MLGRVKSFEISQQITPQFLQEFQQLHKNTEPSCLTAQMIAGKDSAKPVKQKNSWLNRTQQWNYYARTQYIWGYAPINEGLVIDPLYSPSCKKRSITREF